MTTLRGTTWDHPRGAGGLEATALVYGQSHAGTGVTWERRSLKRFGEQSLGRGLPDHSTSLSSTTRSSATRPRADAFYPSRLVLPPSFLELQHEQSTGPSHRSYEYAGHQWALAVDAAAQVSAYRPDLLREPARATGNPSLELRTRESARVAIPLIPRQMPSLRS